MQKSALCRSRGELSNAYSFVKFNFDTAESKPCKICPIDVVRPRVRDDAEDPREARVATSCCASHGPVLWTSAPRQTLEGSFSAAAAAVDRLYRSQILQVNMRLKALEIYAMHSFAQF